MKEESMRNPCVYIMADKKYGSIYTGVTNDLHQSVREHKDIIKNGFITESITNNLVYFEIHSNIISAFAREQQISMWDHKLKTDLIEKENSEWVDLWNKIK